MKTFLYRPRTRDAARRRINRAVDRALATSQRRALEHKAQRDAEDAFMSRLWDAYDAGRVAAPHLFGPQHAH